MNGIPGLTQLLAAAGKRIDHWDDTGGRLRVLVSSSVTWSICPKCAWRRAWFKKHCFRVTLACQSLPHKFGIFRANGNTTEAGVAPAGSGPQKLRLPKPKQREPMRVSLSRHQLLGTFSHPLSNSAA